jgi:hypothetical protein
MPGLLEPVINYYMIYGPVLILISIILTITYLFISNFAAIRSAYLCSSLKNVLTGNLNKCFSSRQGPTCKKSEIGFTHGWCNDSEHYGPLRGTRTGPYSVKCNDWIWQNEDCPPEECSAKTKDWGWCADKGVQRALRGQACGPYSGKCENWIWDSKFCPAECGKATCTDDSCICSTVKARYVILKRMDKAEKAISVLDLKVYDSNGFVLKQTPRITAWPLSTDIKQTLNTGINKDAYLQIDFKEDVDIGRVIISNRITNDNLVGTALVLRKDNNETALYRTISDVSDKYDVSIGNASDVKFKVPDTLTPLNALKSLITPSPVKKAILPALNKLPGSFIIKGDNMCIDSSKKLSLKECDNAPAQMYSYDELSKHLINNKGLCLDSHKNGARMAKCTSKQSQKISYDFTNSHFTSFATGKCLTAKKNKLHFAKCGKGQQKFQIEIKPQISSMFKAPVKYSKKESARRAHIKAKQLKRQRKIEAHKAALKKKAERRAAHIKAKELKKERKIEAHKAALKKKAERRAAHLKAKALKRKKHHRGGTENSELKLTKINANLSGPWGWALNSANDIYKCKNPCKGKWKRTDGKFVQFDVDNKEIWAINDKNEIFKRQVDGLGRWKKIPGTMKSLTLGKTEIYGTDLNNDLYSCKQPCAGKWERSPIKV